MKNLPEETAERDCPGCGRKIRWGARKPDPGSDGWSRIELPDMHCWDCEKKYRDEAKAAAIRKSEQAKVLS